jgi:hypothetical protein
MSGAVIVVSFLRIFLDFLNIGSDNGLPTMNAATGRHEAAGGDDRAR